MKKKNYFIGIVIMAFVVPFVSAIDSIWDYPYEVLKFSAMFAVIVAVLVLLVYYIAKAIAPNWTESVYQKLSDCREEDDSFDDEQN